MHTSKRFVIVSAGRSGSTLLGRALRSHRDVYCFGEILEGDGPEDWEDKGIKLARPVRKCGARRYISSAFFSALRDNTACCGFRLKHYQCSRPGVVPLLVQERVFCIHVIRENVVALSLSFFLARAHDFTLYADWPKSDGRYKQRIHVDCDEFLAHLTYNADQQNRFTVRAASMFDTLEIRYAELANAFHAAKCLPDMLTFPLYEALAIKPRILHINILRQRSLPYSELIANLDDLLSSVRRRCPDWETFCREIEEDSELCPRNAVECVHDNTQNKRVAGGIYPTRYGS